MYTLIAVLIVVFLIFIASKQDNENSSKNNVLYEMFSNNDISQSTFSKYLKKSTSKKEMLSSMIEKCEIDGKVARKYWDM